MMPHSRLVADIGGTNARFGLMDGAGKPDCVRVLPCADFFDLTSAIETYLALVGKGRPTAAAIALANPVTGDEMTMTNHRWSISASALKDRLGLSQLVLLNDFAALALAVPLLGRAELRQVGGDAPSEAAPVALLGAGTGLGVSALLPAGNRWLPLAGEGGHATLAAADDFEAEIIARLRRQLGHVSAERVLSGSGFVALYQTIGALRNMPAPLLSPSEVTGRAIAGEDPLCEAAVTTFCAMFGTVAGNVALTLGARGGVYIGGGIVPKLGTFFERSPFRARFEDKGRFAAYLAPIPCYVIHAPFPGLLGAARALAEAAA